MTPTRYYNLRAANGYTDYDRQVSIIKNYGNIIDSKYSISQPTIESQLRNLGISNVDRRYLVEEIDGTTVTGLRIDKAMNNNLGRNFKTFDNFDETTGIATSVKSVNLNGNSYQDGYKDPNYLRNKLNGYVNETLDFDIYELNRKFLESSMINQRVLHLVFDNQPLTQNQYRNLMQSLDYAGLNGVEIKTTINMGIGGK